MTFILSALYLALPAYIANMAPVLAKKWNLPFGAPISRKWFGASKTYRGFIFGIIGAILMVFLQNLLLSVDFFENLSLIDYSNNTIFLGFLFGFGALFGDLVKSFFKRRLHRPPGSPFVPFDQMDFIIGALILIYWYQPIPDEIIIFLLIITPFLHFMVNVVGYLLKIKDRWW